jgi:hypothetical protein
MFPAVVGRSWVAVLLVLFGAVVTSLVAFCGAVSSFVGVSVSAFLPALVGASWGASGPLSIVTSL